MAGTHMRHTRLPSNKVGAATRLAHKHSTSTTKTPRSQLQMAAPKHSLDTEDRADHPKRGPRASQAAHTNMMASAFEPSLSTSQHRQTMAPAGPSVADTLPSTEFGFDELRDRMTKFTARFDAFIEQGRKRVLEERNQFRMNVAELQGTRHVSARRNNNTDSNQRTKE